MLQRPVVKTHRKVHGQLPGYFSWRWIQIEYMVLYSLLRAHLPNWFAVVDPRWFFY